MALLQALIAALTRSAGRFLNTVFAWATVLLFGRVSEDRQIYVSAVAFGSVIWLIVLVGVAFPSVGTFLLAFVPLPKWVEKTWIRLAMLAAVVVIPALVGVIAIFMLDEARRPRGAGAKIRAVLRGYPYTIGLAITLVMMTAFAPILKLRALAKRWTTEHVPVLIEARDYQDVVEATRRALEAGGIKTDARPASWMLRAPTKSLTLFARGAVANLVADRMTMLRSDTVEIVLHPSDLVISGRETVAARTRAVIAERLVFTRAYLTWDKEANELEDRLRAIWNARHGHPRRVLQRALEAVNRDLHELEVPYEEWEVLFREYLLVERELWRSTGIADRPRSRASRVIAALAVAGPHLARAADSFESASDDVRHIAGRAPKTAVTAAALAVLGAVASILAFARRPKPTVAPLAEPSKTTRRRAA